MRKNPMIDQFRTNWHQFWKIRDHRREFIAGTFWLMRLPHKLMLAMEVYFVYATFRILALWMVPLEPPEGIIPLVDPILNYASTGMQINKDLFFSGHTATLSILYFMHPGGWNKTVFLIGLILMALFLMVQRVHYTIDVLAAPVFSYIAFRIILRARRDSQERREF